MPFFVAVLLALLGCCAGSFAQSGAGSIQGTVMDMAGGVIPGASVRVVNQATAVATETKANNVGFYQVPGLFAGKYVVTIAAPNMASYQQNLQLLVDQQAEIDAHLKPASVTQQVTVAADTIQLTNTNNGTIGSTLENQRINQLPTNGRVLENLIYATTPGLENSGYGGTGSRANGLEGEALEYIADGVTLTNRQFGGMNQTQAQTPDPDAVQEVRIETTNVGAQDATPGVVILTTKSGTNQLHGSFFETARNNAWGVAKGRQDRYNRVAPHLVRNEFGGSIGGPIVLPKLYNGRSKSFWFFAYERYSLAQAASTPVQTPMSAWRNGDFSQLTNSSGILQTLYDSQTTTFNPAGGTYGSWPRQSYTQEYSEGTGNPSVCNGHINCIPSQLISPASKVLYDMWPQPTSNDNPLVANNLITVNPQSQAIPTASFRLDHIFDENNRAYLRYTENLQRIVQLRQNSPASLAADGFPANAAGLTVLPSKNYAAALGFTHVFSPSFFSETILSQQWFSQHNYAGGDPLMDYEKMLGLPNNFGEPGFPGISGVAGAFASTQFIYGMSQIISNIDENLTKTVGRHQMQFGGRFRHERFGYLPSEYPDGVSFGAQATALEDPNSGKNFTAASNTGNANADFFLGAASSYTINLQPPVVHYRDMEFDAYFQDNFHVNNNLTLNLGLRYEAHPAMHTRDDLATSFDFKNHALVLPQPTSSYISKGYTTQAIIDNLIADGAKIETATDAGYPKALLNNYNFTFGPRLGFAYMPFGSRWGTVIRGAYGRFIYPGTLRGTIQNWVTTAPFSASYSRSYTAANQSPDGGANYLMRSKQSVVMGQNSAEVVDSSSTNAILPGSSPGLALWNLDPDSPPDYVSEANFTLEQPMKGNSALRVSWVWTHGQNLDVPFYYNHHPSEFVWEMQTGTALPTGKVIGSNQYAATATGPYDQTTYGDSIWDVKRGWSNDNALQVNYERLFHHGIAYQISYVWSKPMRMGGNSTRDSKVYTPADYLGVLGTQGVMTTSYGAVTAPALPPAGPAGGSVFADYHELDKFANYIVDTAVPKQHIKFNAVVDLPFGKGKRFFGNSNRFLDEVIGGFQMAGSGGVVSQDFQVSSGNWGPTNPLHVYKHGMPINDCRSGVCHKAYEWFNGYIAPTTISGNVCAGSLPNVVSGLPADWAPALQPIDTICSAPVNGKTVTDNYFGKNAVNVTLLNNSTSEVTYSPGPGAGENPYSRTVLNGPMNWSADFSLYKVFPITERVNLRVNADAFNVFNVQGFNNPGGTDGIQQVEGNGVSSSYNTPRQLQFSMRLSF